MSLLELTGVIFGLLSVYFSVKQSIWTWPAGIISVSAFGLLFFEIKLYADMCLQFFFLWSCIQGWYFWLHGGKNKSHLKISTLTPRQRILIVLGTIACILIIGFLFQRFTDATLPYLDSTASGMSVVAQLLLMRKKIENWILWIVVDILSIGIYTYKEVYLTAGLFFVFMLLSTQGLLRWKEELEKCERSEAPS